MSPVTQAVLRSWSFEPGITFGLIAAAVLYLRGWSILRRAAPRRFPPWRLAAFLSGLCILWLAVASPLDPFSGLLLSAHMVQHLLLMSIAPPLLLIGAPSLPLLRGLPRRFAHDGLGPFLTWPLLKRTGEALTHPLTGWFVMAATLCAWHIPAAFDLALRSAAWHKVEHACFFSAAILFWWPVVRPFPSRARWPLWFVPPYLLTADLLNTAISAIFTFSDRVLYPSYLEAPRLFGTTALGDQVTAGVIMWVPGSLLYLIPAVTVAVRLLSSSSRLVRPGAPASLPDPGTSRIALSPSAAGRRAPFDLLTVPILGRLLRARHARRFAQGVLLLLALAVVADGFFGPQVSAANLAGVLPWTYWRALAVVALLVAGNVFCFACPFMLPRELGRRLGLSPRRWPRALRSKWVAVALLAGFFWAYEVFALWDRPFWTAWVVVGYFVAAFVIDAFFKGASFCKYICPIGQFHFVHSLVSPLEVKVRDSGVCASCTTHDCLKGNENQRGCEMELYLPRKAGNMDCTFCLDCVSACPHGNIGLLAAPPGADLLRDPRRSSVGRYSERPDVAALAALLVFAAFANAAAMTAPVIAWQERIAAQFGFSNAVPVTSLLFVVALGLLPALLIGGALAAGRALSGVGAGLKGLSCRFTLALVPLGLAMWAAHFLFHFLTGWDTARPAFQRALYDATSGRAGTADWAGSGSLFGMESLLRLETLLLNAGLLLALYLGWRLASGHASRTRTAILLAAPWALVALALYGFGVWIFLQPMEMRGVMMN